MTDEPKDPTKEDEKPTAPAETALEDEAFHARLETFISVIMEAGLKANEAITKEGTLYRDLFMVLVSGGLETLKHYIEDPEEKAVTWEDPWVESHYSVKWDWDFGYARHVDPIVPQSVIDALRKGEDPKALAASPEVRNFMAEAISSSYFPLALETLTHHVAVHVKGGETAGHFFLEPHLKDELDALPTQEAREARMEDLLKPFSIGGVEVEDESGPKVMVPFAGAEDVDVADAPELHEWYEKQTKDLPKIFFSGEVRGASYRGSVVIMVHNLVVDEDHRQAYFPIVTGLSFAPPAGTTEADLTAAGQDFVAWEPSTWTEEERADFWKFLDESLEKNVREELRKPEEADSLAVAPSVALEPVGSPREGLRTAGVAFGPTIISAQARSIVKEAHRVQFPKKWPSAKAWDLLMEDEARDIYEDKGDHAFEEREPRIRRATKADGTEAVVLTPEGKLRLRRRLGLGRGYVETDKYGRETLFHSVEVGRGGLLEAGFSWYGLAGPLVDEWREGMKREAKEKEKALQDTTLFKDLDEEQRKRVDALLSRLRLLEDGRRIMEAILGQVGIQRRNPVMIPAEAFRVLLWPERAKARNWPHDWKQRAESALSALNAFHFTLRTFKMKTIKAFGSMVGQWVYNPLGQGAHGDGVYTIHVSPAFLGCLEVFLSGKQRLRSGQEADLLDFTKNLTKEEKESQGWAKGKTPVDTYVTADAGGPFYASAARLSPTQENLRQFIERNLTRRGDTAHKKNKRAQVHRKAKEAKERRVYTSAFCPLIPEGKNYFGALGSFRKNPEAGWRLGGSESRAARHTGGLLFQMGHHLPPGSASAKRSAVTSEAMKDIKTVVVDHLGGLVAGYDGGKWVRVEDFDSMDQGHLCRIRLFFFLPEDYEAKVRETWEKATGRRVTESPDEAERETWDGVEGGPEGGVVSEVDGFRGWALPDRLRAMMERRGLRQKDLAPLFGVSAPTVTYWLKGTSPDPEDGVVRGKPIPEDVAPLITRWVETGEAPTAEELAAIRQKRGQRRQGPGRPRVNN